MNTIPRRKECEVTGGFDPPAHHRKASEPVCVGSQNQYDNHQSKLQARIQRELRLRDGAENLFKATKNRSLRDSIAQELSVMNCNLQLLKEELTELQTGGLDLNQNQSASQCVPMIPLSLKEMKDTQIVKPLEDFVSSHYHEDGGMYANELFTLEQMRQACRNPSRNEEGLSSLFEYYNQLYFVEKRFLPPDHKIPITFSWFDSWGGLPHNQSSVSFEKGSILFNISALHTQIAASKDRWESNEVRQAIQHFQCAAGALRYLRDNFSHAPCVDMQSEVLDMLIKLMLAQAQECVFERAAMSDLTRSMKQQVKVAHEAAKVSEMYKSTHVLMHSELVSKHVPATWALMVEVKLQYYKAVAHYHTALALIDHKDSGDVASLKEVFSSLHLYKHQKSRSAVEVPVTENDRRITARAHLRQSLLMHEEALSLHTSTKQPRLIDTFQWVLKQAHDKSLKRFTALEDEDDFSETKTVPAIKGISDVSVEPIPPDFAKYKVADLFFRLGPLVIFAAKHDWSTPRLVQLERDVGVDMGFSIRGDSPAIVADVEAGSLAQKAGMKQGDLLVAVGDRDVKWSKHEEVVRLIRSEGNTLGLTLVTPKDLSILEPKRSIKGKRTEDGRKMKMYEQSKKDAGRKQEKQKDAEKTKKSDKEKTKKTGTSSPGKLMKGKASPDLSNGSV